MEYWAAAKAKEFSPEMMSMSEADVVMMTEGSTLITVDPQLQSWNIAESSGIRRGGAGTTGSETVARY